MGKTSNKSANKINKQTNHKQKNNKNSQLNKKIDQESKKETVIKSNNSNKKLFYIIGGIVVIVVVVAIGFLLMGGKSNDNHSSNTNSNSNNEDLNNRDTTHVILRDYTIEKMDGYDMGKTPGTENSFEIYKEGNEGEYKLFKVTIESKSYQDYKDNTEALKETLEKELEEKVWDIQYRTYNDMEYMVISTGDEEKNYYQMIAYVKLNDKETFYITGQSLKTTDNDERYVEDYDLFSEIAPILATTKKNN